MNRLPTSWFAPFAVALLALGAAAGGGDKKKDIPFEEFGQRFVQSRCPPVKGDKPGAKPAPCPLVELRSQSYARCVLGVFDLSYPAEDLAEKDRAEELHAIAKALLDAQGRWIDLLAKSDVTAAKEDVATLQTWVESWRPASLARAKGAKDKNLAVLLDPNEAQTAAAKRLTEFLLKPASLGIAPKKKEPVRLLFAPTRAEFIEVVGYAGLLDPKQRATLWQPIVGKWTSFWLEWDLVIALQYPPWEDDPAFHTGLPMNKYEANGLQQHVVQQAMTALMWHCYGDGDALYMQQSVALDVTIDVCGEANALEGNAGRGTTGAQTQPYEVFVPGASPVGGVLAPMPAAPFDAMKENQWRAGRGADRFAEPLREGQKNGQKLLLKDRPDKMDPVLARDRYAHFSLLGADEHSKSLVSAPFLGQAAHEKPYPELNFLVDFKEFFRAYRTCFFHWLREHGDPAGEAASREKFRDLVIKTATRSSKKSFESVVLEVYGTPLSGKNSETDSFEWRFLEWLGKGAK
jgi:hypothetical protein